MSSPFFLIISDYIYISTTKNNFVTKNKNIFHNKVRNKERLVKFI